MADPLIFGALVMQAVWYTVTAPPSSSQDEDEEDEEDNTVENTSSQHETNTSDTKDAVYEEMEDECSTDIEIDDIAAEERETQNPSFFSSNTILQLAADIGSLPRTPLLTIPFNECNAVVLQTVSTEPFCVYLLFKMRHEDSYFGRMCGHPSRYMAEDAWFMMVYDNKTYCYFSLNHSDVFGLEASIDDMSNYHTILLTNNVNTSTIFHETHVAMKDHHVISSPWRRFCAPRSDTISYVTSIYEYAACLINRYLPPKRQLARYEICTAADLYDGISRIRG